MTKRIKKLIKKTRHRLNWPVREVTGPEIRTLEITSDHAARTHTIYLPDHDVREIEYLHELGHATLGEQVHPQFATQYTVGADAETLHLIKPACQAASDWFIDAWLMQLCPDEERAEIEEHCALICRRLQGRQSGTPDELFGGALMIAQAIKYCRAKIQTGGLLAPAVDAYLTIEPHPPTVTKLAAVINALLAAAGYPHRVRLIDDQGLESWEVYNP